jgi:hypothetical protein
MKGLSTIGICNNFLLVEMSQKKSPCIAILNKQKCLFKNGEQEGKTGLVWGIGISGRGGHKERVKEGEYGGSTMFSCENGKNETC